MLKEALVLAALAFGQTPSVVDGDTVKLAGVSIRLTDYDSPELFSPKCPKEAALALQARRELQALLILSEAGSLKMKFQARAMCLRQQLWAFVRRGYDRWKATCCPHDRAQICHTLHLPTGLMPEEGRLV